MEPTTIGKKAMTMVAEKAIPSPICSKSIFFLILFIFHFLNQKPLFFHSLDTQKIKKVKEKNEDEKENHLKLKNQKKKLIPFEMEKKKVLLTYKNLIKCCEELYVKHPVRQSFFCWLFCVKTNKR